MIFFSNKKGSIKKEIEKKMFYEIIFRIKKYGHKDHFWLVFSLIIIIILFPFIGEE